MAAAFALTPCGFAKAQPNSQGPRNTDAEFKCSLPKDFRFIRVDTQGKRLFLEGTEANVASRRKVDSFLKGLDKAIGDCMPSWRGSWSASFFSDPELAGYKTEFSEGAELGSWAMAYVAEYDRSTEILTVLPLEKTKIRTRRVIVNH